MVSQGQKPWTDIVQEFKKYFHFLEALAEGVSRMRYLVQNERDSVKDFSQRFKNVTRKLKEPLTDKQNIEWFTLGLLPYLREALDSQQFKSWEEAIELDIKLESQP